MNAADPALPALLRAADTESSDEALDELIAGVAAAPAAQDPEAWLALLSAPAEAMTAARKDRLMARLTAARTNLERTQTAAPGVHAARLAALREELRRRRLSGFVVPKTDEHQSEYLPLCAERLAWLTGFSGTAGTAIVLRERAVLFVDGRYVLQAAKQIDAALFEVCHITGETLAEWVAHHLGEGARLGFDPWLQSVRQAETLRNACGRSGARLIPVGTNPIDAIWTDRPPAPIAPAFHHDEAFAGMSAREKLRHVATNLSEAGDAAAVLTSTDSIAWLLNIRGGDVPFAPLLLAFAIVHADARADVFVDPRKLSNGARGGLGTGVSVAPIEAFAAALDRLGATHGQIRVDAEGAPEAVGVRLRKAGARLRFDSDPCLLPKAMKNPVELAGIRAAHRRDGAALCRFLAWLSDSVALGAQVTEIGAAERLAQFRSENDRYRGPSFPTIAGAGANGAIVHYRASAASNRALEPGSLFLLDSGGQYLDGTTDVTRTVAIGAPTAEMRTRFTLVLKGHIAIATARFPHGTTGSQLDVLARRALWAEGLDYDHGTGHGVGHFLCVHEGPQRISKLPSRVPLEPGMVVSNEPGFYQTAGYGIRIENLVAVMAPADEHDGSKKRFLSFETLTLAPIDRALIDVALLDAGERAWIDRYHARVLDAIAPLVDTATADWLRDATRPLGD